MTHIVGLVVYVGSAYILGVDTETRRWSLRVTPSQDRIVRQALKATGRSLNEYVVGCAVAAAADDLAGRRVFAVSPQVWEELQELLDRPPKAKPRIAALLADSWSKTSEFETRPPRPVDTASSHSRPDGAFRYLEPGHGMRAGADRSLSGRGWSGGALFGRSRG